MVEPGRHCATIPPVRSLEPPGRPTALPLSVVHGGAPEGPRSEAARAAEEEALALLDDPQLARLLTTPRERREVERARGVFVNRNLRLANVEMVGFDMDYTLAIYHQRRIEQLSFDLTLGRLISAHGYPPEVGLLPYDHTFVIRGLVVDRAHGNLLKLDRFGQVGRAWHGLRRLTPDAWQRLYRNEPVRIRGERYAWIDTLFSLPEAWAYAGIIELLESQGHPMDFGRLYDDVREAIDSVHRDNSLKRAVRSDIARYIYRDPELGPALHRLRSGGKKLFLLTNSEWDYTQAVMSHLLDGVAPEYPAWRNYFDVVITGARKPGFFSDGSPFIEVDASTEVGTVVGEATSLDRWKVYRGGNLAAFERMTGFSGDKVLYVGDHIYGDILKSRKASLWRTCMVVQELEDEIRYTEGRREEISRLSEVEMLRARLDDAVNQHKALLNVLERRLEREDPDGDERDALELQRREAKAELEPLRRALKRAIAIAETLEQDVEAGFNPYWGLLFKEGHENSRFGAQVEQYACLYTSRVSNLLHISPTQYLRSQRELMPHEQGGALSGKLAPIGSEGPPKGSGGDDL
jgi:HAD superfamily 5'-nucleotidase-like hydrolase